MVLPEQEPRHPEAAKEVARHTGSGAIENGFKSQFYYLQTVTLGKLLLPLLWSQLTQAEQEPTLPCDLLFNEITQVSVTSLWEHLPEGDPTPLRQHLHIAERSAWWQLAVTRRGLFCSSLAAHRGSATLCGGQCWLRPQVPLLACLGLNPSFATDYMCDLWQVT